LRLSIEMGTEYRTLAALQFHLNLRQPVLIGIILLALVTVGNAGAPTSDLTRFSSFKNLNLAELANGAIAAERRPEVKLNTGLAAEACFIVRQPIQAVIKRLEQWNAVGKPGLDVTIHGRISANPSSNDFNLIGIPKAQKHSTIALLTRQARAFQQRGLPGIEKQRSDPESPSPGTDLLALLSQLNQWAEYFQPILSRGGIRSAPQENYGYWEQISVENKLAIVLGSFTSTTANGGFQAFDLQYFSTSGFSVAATLYQLWPVRLGNTEAALVWRCSMVSTPRVKELRGVERRAAGVAFKNRVKKYAQAIASDLQ
jgi:hypothetical protein